ncbi:iron complex transport system permease protein [Desulfobaculum xiamenense]|uniref:Iron complex transport system permease protein n=1 Tax=Desulfobaculum xiamenense TaxID=995050 RepID=A0A846QRT3_9BACT|nr:iron ABC transporter permease [Desulfobaculum xiamenense]NJB68115.1 iron complex transport system permease protein [Desulfobaculum xiamenense]
MRGAGTLSRIAGAILASSALLAAACALGLCAGSSGFDPQALAALFTGAEADPVTSAIILKLRLPRVLMAMAAGATLATGGLVMQALLRNPLAEPYILGVSGGAAVGAIAALILALSHTASMFAAFAGGVLTLLLVLCVARGRGLAGSDSLLLSGVMINAFCSALILFFVSMVPDDRASGVLHWLMGTVPAAGADRLALTASAVLPGLAVIFLLSHRMNLLTMGTDTARSLGVGVKRVSAALLLITTLMVSAVVCQTGLLGFVGLVVPHILRLVLGPDHRVLVPACALCGAAFMVICDTLARTLPAQGEMPVGVLTAMIGAPLFILLLRRSRQ